ncbi:hypothetical protein [Spirosoma fluminis]
MNQQNQRLSARLAALAFVQANGEELPGGDDPQTLTVFFADVLIMFENQSRPFWPSFSAQDKLHIVRGSAAFMMANNLPALNNRLESKDRFDWRFKLCKLILTFMADRQRYEADVVEADGALDALLERYFLVWEAFHYPMRYDCLVRGIDLDERIPMPFTPCPN